MKKKIAISLLVILLITTSVVFATETIYEGSKLALFKDIKINGDTHIKGEIISIFSDVEVNGTVDGDVISIFGNTIVDGKVDGNTLSVFGSVDMGENSIITRDRIQILGGVNERPNSSIVSGEEVGIMLVGGFFTGITGLIIIILFLIIGKFIISFILSILLVALIPDRINKITDKATNNILRNFAIGLVTTVIIYLAFILSTATVVGIILLPFLAIAKVILGFIGNTTIKIAIGRRIGKNKSWTNMTELIIGSFIYLILDLTIVLKPILYLAKFIGIGAIIDTRGGKKDYIKEPQNNNEII